MKDKEKYIIDRIGNHREPVNTDDLWADLAGHIPQPKKKKRGVIWFTTGLSFVVLGLLIVNIRSWNNSDIKNEKIVLNESPISNASVDKVDPKESVVTLKTNKANEEEILPIESNLKNSSTKEKASKAIQSVNENNNIELQNQRELKKSDQSHNQVATEERKYSKKLAREIYPFNPVNAANTSDSKSKKQLSSVGNAQISITGLVALELARKNHKSDFKLDLLQPKIIEIVKNPLINRWSLYGSIGSSIVDRTLSTNDKELNPELLRRESIENVQGQWQIDLGIGYRLTPKLTLTSGLRYEQIHEEASFNTEYIESADIEKIVVVHKQDGSVDQSNLLENSGTSFIETKEVRRNSIRFLHVPIGLRYNLLRFNNYELSVNGELAVSLSQNYKGYTSFNENESSYNLLNDNQSRFFGQSTLSYGLGVDVSRSISTNIDGIVGITYRKVSGINSNSYLIDQSYNLITVRLGVQRRF